MGENPFGTDPNDIDGAGMQMDLNNSLRLLLRTSLRPAPRLKDMGITQEEIVEKAISFNHSSFWTVWSSFDDDVLPAKRVTFMGGQKSHTARLSDAESLNGASPAASSRTDLEFSSFYEKDGFNNHRTMDSGSNPEKAPPSPTQKGLRRKRPLSTDVRRRASYLDRDPGSRKGSLASAVPSRHSDLSTTGSSCSRL